MSQTPQSSGGSQSALRLTPRAYAAPESPAHSAAKALVGGCGHRPNLPLQRASIAPFNGEDRNAELAGGA